MNHLQYILIVKAHETGRKVHLKNVFSIMGLFHVLHYKNEKKLLPDPGIVKSGELL